MKKTNLVFLAIAFLFFIVSSVAYKPILEGDAKAYIKQAKVFLKQIDVKHDTPSRSPLLSIELAFLLKLFPKNYLNIFLSINFFLIALASFLVYRLFYLTCKKKWLALITGLSFLFSPFVTIYGFMVLSETLTIFMFVASCYNMVLYIKFNKNKYLVFSGIFMGLLILARFNTIALPGAGVICLLVHNIKKIKLEFVKKALFSIVLYSIPILLITGGWAFKNYVMYNKFKLIVHVKNTSTPGANSSVVFINKSLKVPKKFSFIHSIALKIKQEKLNKAILENKKKSNPITKIFGNKMLNYLGAYNTKVRIYTTLKKSMSPNKAYNLLRNYLAWVAQNTPKSKFIGVRLFSFFNSFRYSQTKYKTKPKNINFPPKFLLLSKLLYVAVTFLWFITAVIYLVKSIIKKAIFKQVYVLMFIVFIGYFPVINFVFIILGDANRFFYPTQSLVLGSLIINCSLIFKKDKGLV